MNNPIKTLKYYHTARSTHLERSAEYIPSWLFFTHKRGDFQEDLFTTNKLVKQGSIWALLKFISVNKIETIELPEPLAIRVWPQLILIHIYLRIISTFKSIHVRTVSYCIENYPVDRKLTDFTHIPIAISRPISEFVATSLVRHTHLLVFGTKDSMNTYQEITRDRLPKLTDVQLEWAIPAATAEPLPEVGSGTVFLGTFEKRKGTPEVMAAWEHVLKHHPHEALTIIGKGPLQESVETFTTAHPSVTLVIDPTRLEIYKILAQAKVLVLFSQPAKGWKEQVGLPIVEGLSYGCEIVASTETGIQEWLGAHGHRVLEHDIDPAYLGQAIADALFSHRTKAQITNDLPPIDGRRQADNILSGT